MFTSHHFKISAGVFILTLVTLLALAVQHHTFVTQPFSTKTSYIDAVGPIKAQQVALETITASSSLPSFGHMYEHEVGGYLYTKYGVDGIRYCLPYFDHGCYNGFMLEINSPNKMKTVEAALDSCNKMTLDALAGCIHGAGHQALTSNNYDVPKALQVCDRLAQKYATTTIENIYSAAIPPVDILLGSCTYGVFMENSEPGFMLNMTKAAMNGEMGMKNMKGTEIQPSSINFSEHASWMPNNADLLFPCDSPAIESKYLPGCWEVQAGTFSNIWPTAKTVSLCSTLSDAIQVHYCFIGAAAGFSVKRELTANETLSLCSQAPNISSENTCILTIVQRDYFNGNGSAIPDQICATINAAGKENCKSMQKRMSVFSLPELK